MGRGEVLVPLRLLSRKRRLRQGYPKLSEKYRWDMQCHGLCLQPTLDLPKWYVHVQRRQLLDKRKVLNIPPLSSTAPQGAMSQENMQLYHHRVLASKFIRGGTSKKCYTRVF